MKIGIAITNWKLPIYQRHLEEAGYAFEIAGATSDGNLLLLMEADDAQAFAQVLKAAIAEAAMTNMIEKAST